MLLKSIGFFLGLMVFTLTGFSNTSVKFDQPKDQIRKDSSLTITPDTLNKAVVFPTPFMIIPRKKG